jgi:hypothetical protein
MKFRFPSFGGRFLTAAAVGGAAIFSLLVFPGYYPYAYDHRLYLPPIIREADPSLLPHDFLASYSQNALTYFDEALLGFMRLTGLGLEQALFVGLLAARVLLFYAYHRIVFHFTGNRPFSLLSLVFLIGAHHVVGNTAGPPMDTQLVPRGAVMAIGMTALAGLLSGAVLVPSLLLAVGITLHLPTTAAYLSVWLLAAAQSFRRRPAAVFAGGAALLFGLTALLASHPEAGGGLFSRFDREWLDVLKETNGYVFVTLWPAGQQQALWHFAVGAFLIACVVRHPSFEASARKRLLAIAVIPVVLTAASFFLVDVLKSALFGMLQLPRAFFLWKLVFPPLIGWIAWRAYLDDRVGRVQAFLLAGTALSLAMRERALPAFVIALAYGYAIDALKGRFPSASALRRRLPPIAVFIGAAAIQLLTHAAKFKPIALYYLYDGSKQTIEDPEALRLAAIAATIIIAICLIRLRPALRAADGRWLPAVVAFAWISSALFLPILRQPNVYFRGGSDIEAACGWIRSRTAPDAVFATDLEENTGTVVRVFCHRSVFLSRGDQGQAVFDRTFALEWRKRKTLIEAFYDDPSDASALRSAGITHLLMRGPLGPVDGRLVYEGRVYRVYAL